MDLEQIFVETVTKSGRRYIVRLTDESEMNVPYSIFQRMPLTVGQAIDARAYSAALGKAEYKHALERAVRFLEVRSRSEHEITMKLRQSGYAPEAIAMTMQTLTKHGFIKDAEFAVMYAHESVRRRKGNQRIKSELRQKGISDENIDSALSSIDENDTQNACDLAIAKFLGTCREPDTMLKKRKATQAMLRRGYSFEQIKLSLAKLTEE
ncbi:MAG: regulatory protein RecX [Eubacteriales bacterium]|nr:regulatory protein RecX [Eubacteriales bacterium]MDD3881996.1 regulatory protein RecX [Eubacteriales bacterium]MDD4513726.1 regulatory protein RecX [Eubacteriales bacterium]